jgi:site-specific recombinase XerC
MKCLLAGLMPANELAIETSLRYGMRIGDVLNLTKEMVMKGRFSYREQKTGKRRTIKLSPDFQLRLLKQSGKLYIFEHRTDWRRHRTRQAVYKDIRRIAQALRLGRGISPHSARKIYAVERYSSTGSLKRVQALLNHSDEAVTMLYALADKMETKVTK